MSLKSMIVGSFILFSSIGFEVYGYIISESKAEAENGSQGFSMINTFAAKDSTKSEDLMANSVNLYSGQHFEEFLLASLPGRNEIGFELSLSYSGNVSHIAKGENYRAQSSPFGLGFSINRESIKADHAGTAMLGDDKYWYISGEKSTELRHVENHRYVTVMGEPWIIVRHIDTLDDIPIVIGWTVKKEDGTVYQFGDMSVNMDEPNATRIVHRHGDYVWAGISNDDEPYPFQWDLKRIADAEGLNWVEFDYEQDHARLVVMNTDTWVADSSTYPYTRASYLHSIMTADSNRLVISYENRSDFQSLYGVNTYEYFFTRRASRLYTVTPMLDTVSTIIFDFEYLDFERTPTLQKLLLRGIRTSSPDELHFLPPTRFQYDRDTLSVAYGRIKKIQYPYGAVKEIHYKNIGGSCNFARLDTAIAIDETWNLKSWYVAELFHSGRLFFQYADTPIYGCWDGFWHIDTANIDMSHFPSNDVAFDEPAVSSDGWLAYYDRRGEEIIVRRWEGGYWDTDVLSDIEDTITRWSDENVYMAAGTDCFVVVVGKSGTAANTTHQTRFISRAYYFYWDGNDWEKYPIVSGLNDGNDIYKLGAIKVNGHTFGISYWHYATFYSRSYYIDGFICGMYDFNNAHDLILSPFEYFSICSVPGCENYRCGGSLVEAAPVDGSRFIVGNGFAAHVRTDYEINCYFSIIKLESGASGIATYRLVDGSWDYEWHTWSDLCDVSKRKYAPALLPTGFACTVHDQTQLIRTQYMTSTGFKVADIQCSPGYLATGVGPRIFATNHCLMNIESGIDYADIYEWDGDSWERAIQFGGTISNSGTTIFGESVAHGPGLVLRRYLGNQQWASDDSSFFASDSSAYAYEGAAASNNYMARRMTTYDPNLGDTNYIFIYNPFYYAHRYRQHIINQPKHSCYEDNNSTGFYPEGEFLYHIDKVHCTDGYYERDIFGYRLYDTSLTGKPTYPVVDHMVVYDFANTADPVVQQFEYFGGLLDAAALTPRFAKTVVSVPYRQSDGRPDGFTKYYFYNDIDSADFYDALIYDSALSGGMFYPKLDYPTVYRIANGGYRLDGRCYYKEMYSADSEAAFNYPTSVRYYYSFHNIPDSEYVEDIYRIQLDSLRRYEYNAERRTVYEYDCINAQVKAVKRDHWPPGTYVLTGYKFGYADSLNGIPSDQGSRMLADNAVSQIMVDSTIYDSLGETHLLTKSATRYDKHGSWRPVQNYIWRNPVDQPDDTIITASVLAHDKVGNVISKINGNEIRRSRKYGFYGARVISEATNCSQADYLTQDFEQIPHDYITGSGWDNWYLFGPEHEYGYGRLFSTDCYTGDACWRIADDSDNTENNWGPWRAILADSLTDDHYYFSCWVKGNEDCLIYCWINATSDFGLYKYFDSLTETGWQKVEGVFDLSSIDKDTINSITIQLATEDRGSDTSRYVLFDDFRFHPIDAHVMTYTYEKLPGIIKSESDLNNIPTLFEYDNLWRTKAVRNFAGETISATEYSEPFTLDSTGLLRTRVGAVRHGYGNRGGSTRYFIMNNDQELLYNLAFLAGTSVNPCCTGEPSESYVSIYYHGQNGEYGDTIRPSAEPYVIADQSSGILEVRAGDTVWLSAKSTECVDSCAIGIHDSACAMIEYLHRDSLNPNLSQIADTIMAERVCPDTGIYAVTWTAPNDLKVHYACHLANSHCTESLCIAEISINDSLCDYGRIARLTAGFEPGYREATGQLWAFTGDVITLKVANYSEPCYSDYFARAYLWYETYDMDTMMIPPFTADNPYYVRNDRYNKSGPNTTSYRYFDGLGRPLQTRITNKISDTEIAALVRDAIDYDGRSRIHRIFKPYFDIVGECGVNDFTKADSVLSEARAYYDGDYGVDCGSFPYSEYSYYPYYRGRPHKMSRPGEMWRIDGDHRIRYHYWTIPHDGRHSRRILKYDEDGNLVRTYRGIFNTADVEYFHFTNTQGSDGYIKSTSYNDALGRLCRVEVSDSGSEAFTTRKYWYNALGQHDSSWSVDAGTIRMLYDRAGNLRFVQDAKNRLKQTYVYYKYDAFDRKIEEGICSTEYSGQCPFDQVYADDPYFPSNSSPAGSGKQAQYIWTYDYGPDDLTTIHYGGLARIQDDSGGYIKRFYNYPLEYRDSITTKLLASSYETKSIFHYYDSLSGRLTKMIIRNYPDGSENHAFDYFYDEAGRLRSIREGCHTPTSHLIYDRNYVTYSYTPEGQPSVVLLGDYFHSLLDQFDTIQVLQYTYNSAGWLTGINSPGDVVATNTGTGDANDHFGMSIEYGYGDGDSGYFNGRVRRFTTATSSDTGIIEHEYSFDYNELGWLTKATDKPQEANYREYGYDFLGNRAWMKRGSPFALPVKYYYDTSSPGSSRLTHLVESMNDTVSFFYDAVGNLISVPERPIETMQYDHRNMLTLADIDLSYPEAPMNRTTNYYDGGGQRIRRDYDYYWREWVDPSNPNEPIESAPAPPDRNPKNEQDLIDEDADISPLSGGPGDGGGYFVYHSSQMVSNYLYDGDFLQGIYNSQGHAKQVYVPGRDGAVAVYDENGNRYYMIKDHLGSTRVLVDDSGTVSEFTNYHPFGSVQESWATYEEPLKYTGKEFDGFRSFDYYYYGARYYDAELGRFTSVDPAENLMPNFSPYAYAGNNPIIAKDLDGRLFDIIVDVVSIGYDLYDIGSSLIRGEGVTWEQGLALAADVGCAAAPFVTGGGAAVRAAARADDVVDAIRATDKAADAGKAAKKVPNPHGMKGGKAHRDGVKKAEKIAEKEHKKGYEVTIDGRIDTPGGEKSYRRADVLVKDKQGKPVKAYQVGDVLKDGKTPIKRERKAIKDIEDQSVPVDYFRKTDPEK